jgi:hypothetical protein
MRTVGDVVTRLASLDEQRRELITALGFRSRGFLTDYGELIAQRVYHGSRRAPPSQPGYDLEVDGLGLVQVRTLRSTPTNRRTSMGAMREPYDVLFALCLGANYEPVSAWEIPKAALESLYAPGTRTALTVALRTSPGVSEVPRSRLRAAAAAVGSKPLPRRARTALNRPTRP